MTFNTQILEACNENNICKFISEPSSQIISYEGDGKRVVLNNIYESITYRKVSCQIKRLIK